MVARSAHACYDVHTCRVRMRAYVLNLTCYKGNRSEFRAGMPSLKGRQTLETTVAHLREQVRKHASFTACAGFK